MSITIRKEILLRKLELIAQGVNENAALNQARQEANDRHGKDWRDKEAFINFKNSEPMSDFNQNICDQ